MLGVSELGLAFFIRLDGRQDIQSVNLTRSIYIQSLNPTSYLLLKGTIKGVQRTPTNTKFLRESEVIFFFQYFVKLYANLL